MSTMPTIMGLTDIARSEGDPKILESGHSSLTSSDRLARALGWFSLGLGVAELVAPHAITRALGMEGKEGLVRAYGVREIAAGMMVLSPDKQTGLWSRVAGDGLDIATVMTAWRDDNPKRDNVAITLAVLAGVTLVDLMAAQAATTQHSRNGAEPRDYSARSGFPKGVAAARGAAKDFTTPPDMRALPRAAAHTG